MSSATQAGRDLASERQGGQNRVSSIHHELTPPAPAHSGHPQFHRPPGRTMVLALVGGTNTSLPAIDPH